MKKSDDRHKILISVISIGAVLLIWFLVTNVGSIPTIILPKPQDVWNSFVTLCRDGYGTNKDTLMGDHSGTDWPALRLLPESIFYCDSLR